MSGSSTWSSWSAWPGRADHARVGQEGDELLEEERVAAAAVEQLLGQPGAEVGAGQLARAAPRPTSGGERVEGEHDEVVAAVRRVPALLHRLAGGGQHHEPPAGQPVEQRVDELEHEVVGPVQVGQHDDDRPVGREPLGVGDDRRGGLLAGARRIDRRAARTRSP